MCCATNQKLWERARRSASHHTSKLQWLYSWATSGLFLYIVTLGDFHIVYCCLTSSYNASSSPHYPPQVLLPTTLIMVNNIQSIYKKKKHKVRYWHERIQDMFDVKCKNKQTHLNVILLNGMSEHITKQKELLNLNSVITCISSHMQTRFTYSNR